jgi:hypothetical protein
MVLQRARELGDGEGEVFVRLDMESSDYTERTVDLVEALWNDGFHNTGTVLQSYLRRTPGDLERLIALGSRVRLVKGAYQEPPGGGLRGQGRHRPHVPGGDGAGAGGRQLPAIATHDEAIIDHARRFVWEKGIGKESFEFQMLYGVRRDLQTRLREEGYNVRVYVPFGDSWYPYLMRRLAERPANVLFMAGSILKESGAGRFLNPAGHRRGDRGRGGGRAGVEGAQAGPGKDAAAPLMAGLTYRLCDRRSRRRTTSWWTWRPTASRPRAGGDALVDAGLVPDARVPPQRGHLRGRRRHRAAARAWSQDRQEHLGVDAPADGTAAGALPGVRRRAEVRTSHLDASHAFISGTSAFMYVEGREHEVRLEVRAPAGWRVTTPLPRRTRPTPSARTDYDQLADSPLEIGTHELIEFEVDGVPHRYAIWGRGNYDPSGWWPTPRASSAPRRRSSASSPTARSPSSSTSAPAARGAGAPRQHGAGGRPLELPRAGVRALPGAGGARALPPAGTASASARRCWAPSTTCARATRASCGWWRGSPPTTPTCCCAAPASSPAAVPGEAGGAGHPPVGIPGADGAAAGRRQLRRLDQVLPPGREQPQRHHLVLPQGRAGRAAAGPEDPRGHGNARSLDDVMRALWERYGAARRRASPSGVEAVAAEVAGTDLRPLFDRWLRSTRSWTSRRTSPRRGSRWCGARGAARRRRGPAAGDPQRRRPARTAARCASASSSSSRGEDAVGNVLAGSPAWRAGVSAGDELVALDGLRVDAMTLTARMQEKAPGSTGGAHRLPPRRAADAADGGGERPAAALRGAPRRRHPPSSSACARTGCAPTSRRRRPPLRGERDGWTLRPQRLVAGR